MSETVCIIEHLGGEKRVYELRCALGIKTGAHMLGMKASRSTRATPPGGTERQLLGTGNQEVLHSVYASDDLFYQMCWLSDNKIIIQCLKAMEKDRKGTYQHEKCLAFCSHKY